MEIDNSEILKQLEIHASVNTIYSRLGFVNKLLRETKIANPPSDKVIGIGSKVSIMTFENGEVQNRRVEVINQAVSTELNTDYIEAIGPFGEKIIGLQDNQRFNYRYYSSLENRVVTGEGIVYDINNNMHDELALSPLAYQKKRRG